MGNFFCSLQSFDAGYTRPVAYNLAWRIVRVDTYLFVAHRDQFVLGWNEAASAAREVVVAPGHEIYSLLNQI